MSPASLLAILARALEDDAPPVIPGSPPAQKFEGPWFSTQLILSLSIGITSFLLFCFLRTRWDIVYMGRTKLKDFSPTPAHTPDNHPQAPRFFNWIIPTLRTGEYTVLQTVGLDAAVLLNFFRMSFILFSTLAFLAVVVLMPFNLARHGSTDSDPPIEDPSNFTSPYTSPYFSALKSQPPHRNTTHPAPTPEPTFYDLLLDPQTSSLINLFFTYLFTLLTLHFLHSNYRRFIQSRQAFSLHLIHSIAARTVIVTNLPQHLQGDKALADYFEGCGWDVESVSVCREVQGLKEVLERRTIALLGLERAWADWVGNPAGVKGYDPDIYVIKKDNRTTITSSPKPATGSLIPDLDDDEITTNGDLTSNGRAGTREDTNPINIDITSDPEDPCLSRHNIHTNRPRPTFRPRWFGAAVDSIEYWEKKFVDSDEEVRDLRKRGRFEATGAAFVTFEDLKDAVVHFPHHSQCVTEPAPEPRDVVWSKVGMSSREGFLRDILIISVMVLLILFWAIPVTSVAGLLSYNEIKRIMPWLGRVIDASPRLAAIVQNSLPSLAIITFNGLLPFLLEWLSYQQGFKSRSATEYSLLRKYHLFLLASVLFIFLFATTYLAIIRDLADTPAKIPEKLAAALQKSNAKNFMVSYVMLQSLGLMPLQLLNIGPLFSLGYTRAFYAKTPRDHAEANAPPMLNYGWVYPQAILVFTLTLVYSVVSPLILIFGALYFGVAYLVYKYKVLFIYFKPYESNGEAWPITSTRLLWALIIFQLFMTGLFSLRPPHYLSAAMIPLIVYTLWSGWVVRRDYAGLSRYVALSSVREVERGEGAESVVGVRDEGEVTRSQSNLNHRRYAINDETLYIAPSSPHTDYSQPPMNNFYYGVLNTGRRRYAHPALSGSLPFPWLPSVERVRVFGDGAKERRGVVLSLRRKMGKKLKRGKSSGEGEGEGRDIPEGWSMGLGVGEGEGGGSGGGGLGGESGGEGLNRGMSGSQLSGSLNPWRDPTPVPTPSEERDRRIRRQTSYDPASGVIALGDEHVWDDREDDDDDEEDEDEERGSGGRLLGGSPTLYYPHPERRRTISGMGAEAGLTGGSAPVSVEGGLPQ